MTQPEISSIELVIERRGTGWGVNVQVDGRWVARAIENTTWEAATIGIALAHRSLSHLDKGDSE